MSVAGSESRALLASGWALSANSGSVADEAGVKIPRAVAADVGRSVAESFGQMFFAWRTAV